MPTAKAKPRRQSTTPRALLEWAASAPAGSPLAVDREAGVIKGVKVLGRLSRNSHGLREATNGTEYTRACMEQALSLYEGADVLVDHAGDGRRPRSSADVFGQLRNARLADDGIRADLHFLKSHDLAGRVCEDVERGLGVFGLSHDASAGKERFDPAARRLVIESIAAVRSVDLVRKPATNRNLWESQDPAMTKTLRQLLEALTLTPARAKWRARLLEDDGLAGPMDAPVEAPAGGGGDGIDGGIKQAAVAIIDDDSLDAAGKLAKLKTLLQAHEKISGSDEPDEPAKEEGEDDKGDGKKSDEGKTEAVKKLEHRLKVRDLFEELKVTPDKVLREAAEALPDLPAARKLLEREKARGGSPRSSGPPSGGAGSGSGSGGTVPTGKAFSGSIRD